MARETRRERDLEREYRKIDRIVDEVLRDWPAPTTRRRLPALWSEVEAAFPTNPGKRPVTLRVDADVLDWFQGQGRGYQSRINAVLKAFMLAAKSGAI